jgi:hypothetical protein
MAQAQGDKAPERAEAWAGDVAVAEVVAVVLRPVPAGIAFAQVVAKELLIN